MALPKYKITIDEEYSDGEDLGISAIAFTANPAIKVRGIAFSSDEPKKQLFVDKVKNRITAPALIPMDIYRCDEFEEYYVEFTENEIERLHSKFMKNFTNRQIFNLEHDNENKVNAYVLEAWIVDDPTKDKAFSTYGIKVPKGTVMITAQINDKQTYDDLVANEQTGLSIEGYLGMSLSEIINKKIQKDQKMEENKMQLPAGEYPMGDKILIVAEDGTFILKDKEAELADEPKKDEVPAEDVKKEELADEIKEEVKEEIKEEVKDEELAEEVPAPVEDTPSDVYSKAEVDAKFEEMMQMIAELKAEKITEEIKEELPVQLSAHKPKVTDAIHVFNQALKNK